MVTTVPAESQGYVDTEVQEGIHTAVVWTESVLWATACHSLPEGVLWT